MPEKFEGGVPPQEHKGQERRESKEERSSQIWGRLADAFGGYSQVPDYVVGMAIAGQINNNGLEFGSKQLDEVVDQICERWEDQDPNPAEVRAEIIRGMKEMTKGWTEDKGNQAVAAVRALEGEK